MINQDKMLQKQTLGVWNKYIWFGSKIENWKTENIVFLSTWYTKSQLLSYTHLKSDSYFERQCTFSELGYIKEFWRDSISQSLKNFFFAKCWSKRNWGLQSFLSRMAVLSPFDKFYSNIFFEISCTFDPYCKVW